MYHVIAPVAGFIRHYLNGVCLGMTAVSIMLVGPFINGHVRQLTQKYHWLIRYIVLVLMCTAGYGFLAHVLFKYLHRWLQPMASLTLIAVTAAIYLALAFFARNQGKI
jgi:cation transport ATPase